MTGFVVERHGFANAQSLIISVITDLLANGFTQPTSSGVVAFDPSNAKAPLKVTLQPGTTVDPLSTGDASAQPWRICFDLQALERCFVYVATPLQLPDDGSITIDRVVQGSQTYYTDVLGAIGAQMGASSTQSAINSTGQYSLPPGVQSDEVTKGIINRTVRVGTSGAGFPLSYRLSITPRGIWLGVWEDATTQESSNYFNWFLVQRPVDRTTGAVLTTGKAPVFCVSGVGGSYWQFVVRESDILRPGKRRVADSNDEDSEAVLNTEDQVSLSEDGKYIVTFPSRLNTSRYRYPHELDMLATTSADVVSQFSDVPLTVYGESSARSYKAMQANGANNTGMRILIIQNGGGISGS